VPARLSLVVASESAIPVLMAGSLNFPVSSEIDVPASLLPIRYAKHIGLVPEGKDYSLRDTLLCAASVNASHTDR
jgi:hypothetical protein